MRLWIRHCERSEAIQEPRPEPLDCFVASLLAMTGFYKLAFEEQL